MVDGVESGRKVKEAKTRHCGFRMKKFYRCDSYQLAERFFCCQKALIPTSHVIREREHFSRSVMVSVAVSKVGKTSVAFVDPSAKVDSNYYCTRVLGQSLLPDITAKCGLHKWTIQQDYAPSHNARNTIVYLRGENVAFIEPDMWPPNSPLFNPLNYAIWGP